MPRCHSFLQPLVEDSSQERFIDVEVRSPQSGHHISYIEKSILGSGAENAERSGDTKASPPRFGPARAFINQQQICPAPFRERKR